MLSFAQENSNEKVLNRIVPSSISISEYENSRPAIFIDGERVDKSIFTFLFWADSLGATFTLHGRVEEKKSGSEIILGLSGISTVILISVQEVTGLELSDPN